MNSACEKCGGKCCKTLVFGAAGSDKDNLELLRTRAVAEFGGAIWIDARCKHLVNDECSIYADRPAACSAYPVHGAACVATRSVDIQ